MSRSGRIPEPTEVTDETLGPPSVAAEVATAHGVASRASAEALRREAQHGRPATCAVFERRHRDGDGRAVPFRRSVGRCIAFGLSTGTRDEATLRLRRAWTTAGTGAGRGQENAPPVLRHTSATWAVRGQLPFGEAAKVLGTTERVVEDVYGHPSREHPRGVVESVSGRRR